MIVIGVDIGLTGALAANDSRGSLTVEDIPTIEQAHGGKRICGRGLILLIRQFVPPGESAVVVIEDVRPRAGGNGGRAGTNSMHSQGSMMRSRGIVEAVVDVARLDLKVVQPQTWKRHFGLIGKDKADSRAIAQSLFPVQAGMFKRVKDHNRAEAALIAHFGRSRFA